jgi:hypothetical protein
MIADDVRRRLIIGGTNIPKLHYPYYVSIDKNDGVIEVVHLLLLTLS